eukprot:2208199-Prymnesium_polylepis.1
MHPARNDAAARLSLFVQIAPCCSCAALPAAATAQVSASVLAAIRAEAAKTDRLKSLVRPDVAFCSAQDL